MSDWHYPLVQDGIAIVDGEGRSVAVCADGPTAVLIVDVMNREYRERQVKQQKTWWQRIVNGESRE